MIWGWLTGGIFLGWSLGANDAANVFGTAVGTRSVKFVTAVICICIFCVLGAYLDGAKDIETISSITKMGIRTAFVASFTAALTVTIMTFFKLPVSTSQAVVGAIIGMSYALGQTPDFSKLATVFTCWVGTPVGAMVISFVLYYILASIWNLFAHRNMLLMDSILKILMVVAGSYGAYALGANNVANVVGVFAGTDLADFSPEIWSLIGAGAICLGVITFSKRVMMTVGANLVPLDSFTAFVAVLAEAITVHIYAMVGVPVSTSQAMVGAVLGIGLVKGMKSVNARVLVNICVGWVSTPLVAGVFGYGIYTVFFR